MRKIYFIFLLLIVVSSTIVGQEQLTNLPTFYINTKNKAPVRSKEVYLEGNLTIVSSDVSENFSGDIKIRGRGNSTWGMPKKPFRIKLLKKKRLLNQKAKAKSWVLLANYADKSLIRNAVAFKIGKILGFDFTPSARFVDVVLNGEYLGNYMLSDQVQVKKGRVEVEEQKSNDVTKPNITGGYLLEFDGFAYTEPSSFKTKRGGDITIKYPKDDEINSQQYQYISDYINHFEDVLFSNKKGAYRAYVDINSLVNWYIACELTGNPDSFWSTYIYKKRNDPKIYFGPMWDYDIAFNNDNRLNDATYKLMLEYAYPYKRWIEQFWKDKWFRKLVINRWEKLINNNIEQQLINYITEQQSLLNESQQLNYQKWKTLGKVVYREQFTFPTYAQNVEYIKSYIKDRIAFLTRRFEMANYKELNFDSNTYYYIINKKNGNVIDVSSETTDEGTKLILWELTKDKLSQHWKLNKDKNNYFTFTNRVNGKSIKETGKIGTNLVISKLNRTENFKWRILETKTKGYFNIVGNSYGYIFDNPNDNVANGTPLIESDNDINKSENTKFAIVKVGTTGLLNLNCRVVYNPINKNIIILTKNIINEKMALRIYDLSGEEVLHINSFNPKSGIDVSSLFKGVYIIKLMIGNKNYSTKFIKQ